MYAAFYLVVVAIVWSASDIGRTVEAKANESGKCKALVDRAIKIVDEVKHYQEDSLATCQCGMFISRIEVTDKDDKDKGTLDLCTGCPGRLVPLKDSNFCGNCRHRRFRNFAPFCTTALDQCNGKGVTIYACKCQGDDGATPLPVTDPAPEATIQAGQTIVPPVNWMDY